MFIIIEIYWLVVYALVIVEFPCTICMKHHLTMPHWSTCARRWPTFIIIRTNTNKCLKLHMELPNVICCVCVLCALSVCAVGVRVWLLCAHDTMICIHILMSNQLRLKSMAAPNLQRTQNWKFDDEMLVFGDIPHRTIP